jgi:hypothetical protein
MRKQTKKPFAPSLDGWANHVKNMLCFCNCGITVKYIISLKWPHFSGFYINFGLETLN